jgi:hypothetical protein
VSITVEKKRHTLKNTVMAQPDKFIVFLGRTFSCNGLQSKLAGTAISENLGPDYMHLSIPSGRDYLQLRLLLSSWDCNQRRWDHIRCD